MPLRLLFVLSFALLASSCGGGGVSAVATGTDASLGLDYSESPIELSGISARFAADVAYDNQAQTQFDIFLPEASERTGLVIYLHGGGFTSGDKSAIYQDARPDEIRESLSQGVAFASVNYRLLDAVDADGVLKPLGDSRRALQFIRHYATDLNIDPDRIAVYGDSAGAGTSLWLAFHDDMADPFSTDPILRQSTRIAAVGAIETQASYDIFRWESDVFSDYGITVDALRLASPILSERLLSFYGASSADDLQSDEVIAYRADVDLLNLMSVDDPAMWLRNSEQALAFPVSVGQLFHHPYHARELKEQADAIGLSNVSYIPQIGVSDPSGEEVMSFMLRYVR